MRRLLSEPLLHFLVLGAVLVTVLRFTAGDVDPRPLITIDADTLATALADWQQTRGREPDAAELAAIRAELETEALLLAEARALGLERHDPVVRQRLADLAVLALAGDVTTPDEATLRAWFEADRGRWREAERIVVEQVPVGVDPASRRAALAAGADPYAFPVDGALPVTIGPVDRAGLAARLGAEATSAVFALDDHTWSEPVATLHGPRLLRIIRRSPATGPEFERLRYLLAEAWQREAFEQRRREVVEDLRARYRVEVAAP